MADTAAASTGGSASTTTATTTTAGRYNPEEAGRKLLELDALVPQVAAALHQDKFKQVQAFLKKNNDLIQTVMAQQAQALAQEQQSKGSSADAASASAEAGPQEQLPQGDEGEGEEGVDKALLQQCAEMIKELNDNLTQVYDLYAELAPAPKEE